MSLMDTKCCRLCQQNKTLDNFHKRSSLDNTYRSECKECANILKKQYRDKNKEQIKIKSKIYYESNKDKIKTLVKEYKDIHRNEIRESKKEKVKCICGLSVSRSNYSAHIKTTSIHFKRLYDKVLTELSQRNNIVYQKQVKKTYEEKLKAKIKCQCGSEITKASLSRHNKTSGHRLRVGEIDYKTYLSIRKDYYGYYGPTSLE